MTWLPASETEIPGRPSYAAANPPPTLIPSPLDRPGGPMADPAAASARAVDDVTDVQLANLPPQGHASRELLVRVDQLARAEMARQGRDPAVWERLTEEFRDELRLAALRRIRNLEP